MENWKAAKGYEGAYEVSDLGNVRSIDRTINRNGITKIKGRALIPLGKRHKRVWLSKEGKRRMIAVHRLVYETFNGELIKGLVIDHINNNPCDNRACNLQQIDCRENNTKDKVSTKGLPHGVTERRDKYVARFNAFGKHVYLGSFDSIEEAKNVYDSAMDAFRKDGTLPTRDIIIRDTHKDGTKRCTCCGNRKPLSEYYFSKKYNMYQSKCKECYKKDIKDRYKKKTKQWYDNSEKKKTTFP